MELVPIPLLLECFHDGYFQVYIGKRENILHKQRTPTQEIAFTIEDCGTLQQIGRSKEMQRLRQTKLEKGCCFTIHQL